MSCEAGGELTLPTPDRLAEQREQALNMAEAALFELVEDGDWQAVSFILRTLGRSRGYGGATAPLSASTGPLEIVVRDG